MKFTCPFVLASTSPRRRQLLEQLGLTFNRAAPDVDESFHSSLAPPAIVESLAERKATAVAHQFPDALVLAADTIVVLDGEILNKPATPDEAVDMLGRLSGRTHVVYTGIALAHAPSGRRIEAHEATRVTFATLNEREIAAYVATGSPMDKAGAYGIQDDRGALFVSGIEGDYYTVVGLPLHRLYTVLKTNFSDLLIG
ncbi:MAG: Maf family protein [Rhodothermales bacterium]|nr:Maf family protein [Rhodothermales bacterium]